MAAARDLITTPIQLNSLNFYELLVISQTASEADIRKAYRTQALLYHTDKNKHEFAGTVFNRLKQAQETLLDPNEKYLYDQKLKPKTASASPKAESNYFEEFLSGYTRAPAGADTTSDHKQSNFERFFKRTKSTTASPNFSYFFRETPPSPAKGGSDNFSFNYRSPVFEAKATSASIDKSRVDFICLKGIWVQRAAGSFSSYKITDIFDSLHSKEDQLTFLKQILVEVKKAYQDGRTCFQTEDKAKAYFLDFFVGDGFILKFVRPSEDVAIELNHLKSIENGYSNSKIVFPEGYFAVEERRNTFRMAP